MQLEQNHYYHFYNRTNNRELLFRERENNLYFLRSFRSRFEGLMTVYAYCLMPTHFHFLIRIDTEEIVHLKKQIGIFLSAYTKAVNNAWQRHGNLFQQHSKAKCVDDYSYLLTLVTYIHQNPVRAGLVNKMEEWPYSSYCDLAGLRNGTLPNYTLVESMFKTKQDFRKFSEKTVTEIRKEYWINS